MTLIFFNLKHVVRVSSHIPCLQCLPHFLLQILDDLEDQMEDGGVVVEHHSNDFFPERWFDLVIVLRTNNTVLYDRLQARGYDDKKINENVTAEIMEVVADQARSSYAEEVVVELESNSIEDLESNADRIVAWVAAWMKNNSK